jgi:hypothetical protein
MKRSHYSVITNNTFCKEQQHSQKQEFFRDFGVAEAPPGFQWLILHGTGNITSLKYLTLRF